LELNWKKKQKEITERKEIVEKDLSTIKPKLEAAEKALKKMDDKKMRTLKSLTNPPPKVKKALEAVMLLYTEKDYSSDWKGLLKVMVDPQFLKEVLSLNVETKKKSTIKTVREKYLNNEKEWNIDDITKAFEPAGLLAHFIQS